MIPRSLDSTQPINLILSSSDSCSVSDDFGSVSSGSKLIPDSHLTCLYGYLCDVGISVGGGPLVVNCGQVTEYHPAAVSASMGAC